MIRAKYEERSDPEQSIKIVFDNKQEKDILMDFCNFVQAKDPDIIVFWRRSLCKYHLGLHICKDCQVWTGPASWKRKEECSTTDDPKIS